MSALCTDCQPDSLELLRVHLQLQRHFVVGSCEGRTGRPLRARMSLLDSTDQLLRTHLDKVIAVGTQHGNVPELQVIARTAERRAGRCRATSLPTTATAATAKRSLAASPSLRVIAPIGKELPKEALGSSTHDTTPTAAPTAYIGRHDSPGRAMGNRPREIRHAHRPRGDQHSHLSAAAHLQ